MRKTQVDLIGGGILRSMLLFALPFLVSNIFQQLYNTVDTIIVGHNLGETSLAAIGAGAPLFNLLVGLAMGVGTGMGIVMGRSFGSGDEQLLRRSVAASLVVSAFVTAVLVLFSRTLLLPVLELLDTPAEILLEAYSYIQTIVLFVGVMMLFNLFSSILRAIGDSLMPLVFLAISAVMNIALDLLFIRQFGMGVKGAAIATIVAQGLSAVLCLIYIWRKCKFLLPSLSDFKFDKALYLELFGQGLSMGLMTSLVNIGSLVMQSAINGMGYLVIAGHLAGRKLFFFAVMPLTALCFALSTFVAQNKGANQGLRIRQAVRYTNLLAIFWSLIVSILAYFTAPTLIKMLTGSQETVLLEAGVLFVRVETMFFVILGPLFNFRYALQGIGRKVVPLVSSLIELVGKVVFTFWIIPVTGYLGVVFTEPIIWFFMLGQLLYSFYTDPYIKIFGSKAKIQAV